MHVHEYIMGRSATSMYPLTNPASCAPAGMENIGLAKTTASGYAILLTLTAALSAATYLLYSSSQLLSKVCAVAPALLGAAVVFAFVRNLQFDE